jgi:sortase family protein
LGDVRWRRIAGLRVVMSWPDSGSEPAPVPRPPARGKSGARFTGIAGVLLLLGGAATVAFALVSQVHAPQPGRAASGRTGASVPGAAGPSLRRSVPISVDIPAIGVHSELLRLGMNADGTIAVPPLTTGADEAAWYKYSATPGQIGAAVIEGHVDSYHGPAVFFRLGALRLGDTIDVTLADGIMAIFRVTGVREYSKAEFPSRMIYGTADYAALRLITCGGSFDSVTGHYLSSTVVFASLTSYRKASHHGNAL